MMKKLFILFLFFISQIGQAQPYLDATCEWRYYYGGWNINSYSNYDTVYFDGTVVINGITYFKQYRRSLEVTVWWSGETTSEIILYGPGYIREDAFGNFYYLDSNNADSLYFDNQAVLAAQVGDLFPNETCTVQSIQDITLGTSHLKKINGTMNGPTRGMIEGVGYLGMACGTGIEGNRDMQCFTKQGNTIQFGTIDCNAFPTALRTSLSTSSNTLTDVIKIFPNPTKELFTIVNNFDGQVNYTLNNIQGSIIRQGKLTAAEQEVDISNLASGVYLLKLEANQQTVVKKIFKE